MLPTPAPAPTIDPCNHPPAIVGKAPIRGYNPDLLGRRGAMIRGASDPFNVGSINGIPPAHLAVAIDVAVAVNGAAASARVIEPSGDMGFDRASVDAALQSTYTPAAAKCAIVSGHYTFTETLGPSF